MIADTQRLSICKAPSARTLALLAALVISAAAATPARAQKRPATIPEINNYFHFLNDQDTLLIHEEDGKLRGQVNAYQGEDESDAILSYLIIIGTRQGNHVVIKTSKVHERYYRFSGNVEWGTGRKDSDPDYLRLVGTVDIVTVHGETGKETTETRQVVLKSLSPDEIP